MGSDHITQLQIIQQNLQNTMMQKQQFQQELVELESALRELPKSSQSFQIVGKLMISKSRENLEAELNERKEIIDLRINNFEKQEKQLKVSLEETQKKALEELKAEKKV
ncbi:MAG: prefoldin subunit [archaeon]